jgi:hypothetical protein
MFLARNSKRRLLEMVGITIFGGLIVSWLLSLLMFEKYVGEDDVVPFQSILIVKIKEFMVVMKGVLYQLKG